MIGKSRFVWNLHVIRLTAAFTTHPLTCCVYHFKLLLKKKNAKFSVYTRSVMNASNCGGTFRYLRYNFKLYAN